MAQLGDVMLLPTPATGFPCSTDSFVIIPVFAATILVGIFSPQSRGFSTRSRTFTTAREDWTFTDSHDSSGSSGNTQARR